ncbi:MAG: sigma-70 family RNA polymerase sigma factor [Planctomycetes bacterium]|nr:sigma-70 family RNA polymerase sigma factor [Planctomycetota bacterium]
MPSPLSNDPPPPEEPSASQLWAQVYSQLRTAADHQLHGERKDHTLSATALVNEAWLKLGGPNAPQWQGRAQFYAAAVEAMRRLLIDYARSRSAQKRGGPGARRAAIELTTLPDLTSPEQSAGFLILDEAILRLAEADAQAAEIVRLRYFAGLSIEETATTLGISAPTVKRSWAYARGWLRHAIESERD